jgi:holo-[acyl-carrier protein] synthase
MEIVGLGTEIVECVRIREMIDRHGELFLARVFTDDEVRDCQSHRQTTEQFAARWAAKEAVFKCLGTGRRHGSGWAEVEVWTAPDGRPRVRLYAAAKERAEELWVNEVLLTLAHCRAYATATAVAVRTGPRPG